MTTFKNSTIKVILDDYVAGHDEAKKTLITLLSRSRLRHFQKYIKGMDDEYLISPMKVLLVGGSGSGKTFLVESLQRAVHFPLVRLDATQLTPSGAGGGVKVKDIHDMIIAEAKACAKEFPWAYPSVEGAIDRTIVFVDEIDKLGRSFDSSGNWNKNVQSNFLTTFENRTTLSGVSFVFAGAFDDITGPKEQPKHFGFGAQEKAALGKKELIDLRVMKSGLIPELVGRLTAIVELDPLTIDVMHDILIEKVLPRKMLDLAAYHLFDAQVPEEHLVQISEEAVKSGQGVRYLIRAVDRYFLDLEYRADIDRLMFGHDGDY